MFFFRRNFSFLYIDLISNLFTFTIELLILTSVFLFCLSIQNKKQALYYILKVIGYVKYKHNPTFSHF